MLCIKLALEGLVPLYTAKCPPVSYLSKCGVSGHSCILPSSIWSLKSLLYLYMSLSLSLSPYIYTHVYISLSLYIYIYIYISLPLYLT